MSMRDELPVNLTEAQKATRESLKDRPEALAAYDAQLIANAKLREQITAQRAAEAAAKQRNSIR